MHTSQPTRSATAERRAQGKQVVKSNLIKISIVFYVCRLQKSQQYRFMFVHYCFLPVPCRLTPSSLALARRRRRLRRRICFGDDGCRHIVIVYMLVLLVLLLAWLGLAMHHRMRNPSESGVIEIYDAKIEFDYNLICYDRMCIGDDIVWLVRAAKTPTKQVKRKQ